MRFRIFCQLIRRDLEVFKRDFAGRFLDLLITFVAWVIIFGYFVPQGKGDYGLFIMVGAIASFGVFNIIGQCGVLITDIQTDKTISYLLALPISSRTVFIYRAVSWALQSFCLTVPLYIAGKALFWSQLDLNVVNWVQLAVSIITVNIFYGFFSLWLVGVLHKIVDLNRVYFRFINPLFVFGCYFVSWETTHKISKGLGGAVLADPFTYVMEISRAAVLGQSGYIYFWYSFAVLCGFILLCATDATRRLKKILDCI